MLFRSAAGAALERDTGKEAGLAVLLENLRIIVSNCSGKEFKDGKIPLLYLITYGGFAN